MCRPRQARQGWEPGYSSACLESIPNTTTEVGTVSASIPTISDVWTLQATLADG